MSVMTLTLGAAGVVLLAACGGSTSPYGGGGGGGGTCTPTASKVCMTNALSFNPSTLTITAGTTVTWQNGSITHTVTSDAGSAQTFDSGNIGNGGTFTQTFNTAGTYAYHCKIHVASGMTGTITVTGP